MEFVLGEDEFSSEAYMFALHKGDRCSLAFLQIKLFVWAYIWYTNNINLYILPSTLSQGHFYVGKLEK